jgi:membrane-bound ClpP family serine protease
LIEALADPRWAAVLLFVACFALMTEAMSPGIGVPGFVAALCFSLFFWSQFLQGTAGWLEVTLFLLGASCLALEIFVLPGFGVFGLGGAALVIASVVLASQTFVIPETSEELAQLPQSLGQLFLGGMGLVAALVIMRRILPRTRVYKRLVLAPPEGDELADRENRESLVQLIHLVGKRGVTLTRLVPAGKVRFGDEVVNVLSRAGMIEAGADVLVVEVTGNRVIVEEIG